MFFALQTPTPLFIAINTIGASIILYRVMRLVDGEAKKAAFSFRFPAFIQLVIVTACIFGLIYLGPWGVFALVIIFGGLLFIAFTQLTEQTNLGYALARGWELFRQNNNQGIKLQFMLILLSFSFLLVLSAPLLYMHTSILQWNFSATDVWATRIVHIIELFIKTVSFYLIIPILSASISYLYFSMDEISSAHHLKESISKMDTRMSKNVSR
jgi:hypothetical protein